MKVTPHVYQLHIQEDPDLGVMHPGGSNIYFVGDPAEEMVVIDTGEHYRNWTRSILDFYKELGRPTISSILITHGHMDHIGGVDRLQEEMRCSVRCHPKLEKRLAHILDYDIVKKLRSKEVISIGNSTSLLALFTPGHEDDHVSYYLASDSVMFTGDTVLGSSSTAVRDLGQYMRSLEILASYNPSTVCPAHGPVVLRGIKHIRSYITHRQERERQVLAALEKGLVDVYDIVREVYPRNLKRGLRGAAVRNVITHLAKLKEDGRVTETSPSYTLKSHLHTC